MGLYKTNPDLGGFAHADAYETDRKLREGDGLMWPGDPALELHMGILTAKRTGFHPQVRRHVRKGEVIARRYEVWSTNFPDAPIAHWTLEEYDRIIFDMARMRLDSPGHVDTGLAVDANNDKVIEAAQNDYAEHYMEGAEHLGKLIHDRTQPKNVFRQMPGTGEGVKVTDKRASAQPSETPAVSAPSTASTDAV